jgi:hypothetical protein
MMIMNGELKRLLDKVRKLKVKLSLNRPWRPIEL